MITHEEIEEFICQYPVYQYAFFPPEEIEFSFRVRWICEKECERYNSTWACPPAVGSVEECRKRCLGYRECFLFSTIAEVSDVINFEETLATRKEHEAITAAIENFIRQQGSDCMALSTESCDICETCTFPQELPCRFPEKMHPCVESHGIIVSELAEKYDMEFTLSANQILWFGILFIN
ncbi:MAG TPA: DUF2284 domain-containing protein [Candidatus Blautia stercoravium]|nr:DUF2284 domain-containing protein [Candidatus Blautia stercoravium]